MGAPDRSIRHLRLRAPDEASVRHAALQLEDALRCASLPDEGGRLLFVRRLSLGRMEGEVSSAGLSRRIEEQVRQLGLQWVHGLAPRAIAAQAVWFRDRHEAIEALALHLAAGKSTAAWFWPLVFRGLRGRTAMSSLKALLRELAGMQGAPASLPATIATLIDAGHGPLLLQLFSPIEAQALLQAAGIELPRPTTVQASPASPTMDVMRFDAPAATTVVRYAPPRSAAQRGVVLPRQENATWLHLMLRAAGWRAEPSPPADTVPDAGPTLTTAPAPSSGASRNTGSSTEIADGPSAEAGASDARPGPARAEDAATPAPLTDVPPAPIAPPPAARHATVDRPRARLQQQQACDDSVATLAGGLLFLLPVLARLGYPAWQAANDPDDDGRIAARCLSLLLQRLGVCADPAAELLVGLAGAPDVIVMPACSTPAIWSDPRIGLSFPAGPVDTQQAAALWLRACRRYLRRVAGIGPASLALRPARLAWTKTHVDLRFALSASDLRIRRAGLDIDPGWLPWLGRVVAIHYQQAEAFR